MAELDNPTSGATAVAPSPAPTALTAREKRDLQKAQLRPLANRRPELYERTNTLRTSTRR
jgi:small subunit ribosomal protein S1